MYIKFEKGLGSSAVKRLTPVLRTHEAMPELSGILLETNPDGFSVTAVARNELFSAEIQFPALVLEPGSTVLNGSLLNKILELFGEGFVEMRTAGQENALLACGRTEYTLATRPAKNIRGRNSHKLKPHAGSPRFLTFCAAACSRWGMIPSAQRIPE